MRSRVAVVCRGCGAGGSVARVALRQADELGRTFSVDVVSESFPAAPGGRLTPVRITPCEFRPLRRFAHVPNEIAFARSARFALLRAVPQVVITHSHAVAWLAGEPLRKRSGTKIALVMHGDIFDRPAGMYDARLAAFYRFVTPRAYQVADVVVALSPYMAEYALAGGARRVEVIPNGIDASELGLTAAPSRRVVPSDRPLQLLYVGRLSVEKGVEHLLDACRRLDERGVAFRLTVIGDGPVAGRLRRSAAGQPNVVFLPARDRNLLGAAYQAADLVCLPSLSEALPSVALEALTAGTPLLATDTGGSRFIVQHGENGLLVPPASAGAMADALDLLARDRSLLQRLTDRASASVEQFRWDAVGERLTAVIRETIG